MGYHFTVIDQQEEETTETVYFSSFLPMRHRRWYFGDPTDCFTYFHEGYQKLGSRETEDFSGTWEPDWDWCLKMTYRMLGHVEAYDLTKHESYSEGSEAAEKLKFYHEKDRALYEQIRDICKKGVGNPGRFVVRMSV